MTEPIYELDSSWSPYIVNVATGQRLAEVFAPGCAGNERQRARAEHMCRLLNADPLPEHKPKRFKVMSEGARGSRVGDATNPAVDDVVWFSSRLYPDHRERAQAEADRLNGEVA